MAKIQWQNYSWLTQERWGQIHPDKPQCWYDSSAIVDHGGDLELKTHYNPKSFNINGKTISSPIGVGLISCTEKFSYGYFEMEAVLPAGPLLWPAFWMWSWDSWPPEIDIFEGYTNKTGSYFNWSHEMLLGKFWRTPSNIHLGSSPNNYSLGAKNHWMGWCSPSSRYNKYAVEWTPSVIAIFINDKPVHVIDDPTVLSQFANTKMNVIINNGIQNDYTNLTNLRSLESSMHIAEFKYQAY